MALESAIPPHLVQERTLPTKTPPNYDPPFPAYTARFPTEVKDIVMAVIGAQHCSNHINNENTAIPKLIGFLQAAPEKLRPKYWEPASVADESGAFNESVIAYWQGEADYRDWASKSGFDEWWASLDAAVEGHGWFLEIFLPTVDRFETLFSDNADGVSEGASYMKTGLSGPLAEHVYWGSMRDRLPVSQTDALESTKEGTASKYANGEAASSKQRLRVHGKKNLAVIRSGQDWSNTSPHERKLYLDTMHPVLIKGMEFLRDSGDEVGCFSCRFMDVLDASKLHPGIDKTFGLAYFDDLSSLEYWSKQHKTHLDIFGRFLQYAKELQSEVSLRLFHEVLVLKPEQQFFEYVFLGRTCPNLAK